jgi:predicted RNA methylase
VARREDAFDVYVAGPKYPDGAGPIPVLASCVPEAERIAANIAGVSTDRCLALPARTWDQELLDLLDAANARAEAEVQQLRAMHAKILGIPLEELDARVAADKAKEDAERAARRPAKRSTRGARGERGEGIGSRRLTERQRELLGHVRVEGNVAVYVPEERIEDWAALKAVLVALGGTWRSRKGFVFDDDVDAAEVVRLALETGEILDPTAADFFPTPAALADRVVELAEIRTGHLVLEPSAGKGALAMASTRACPGAALVCVEALPANAAALRDLRFTVFEGDFLQGALPRGRLFDRVVMNPPFGKRADVHHVRRALEWLKPDGRLVAIMSAGVAYRQDRLATEFRALVESRGGWIEQNPEGSFLESGTGVRTVTVAIPGGAS